MPTTNLTAAALAIGIIAQTPADPRAFPHHLTVERKLPARDIDGLTLGMTISEVKSWAGVPIHKLGSDQGEFNKGSDHYRILITPMGRLYMIERDQPLGAFIPDRQFTVQLEKRLVDKFGAITSDQLPSGPAIWTINEDVVQPDGSVLKAEAESMSARITGIPGIEPLGLNLRLESRRLRRADEAAVNAPHASEAADRLHF